MAEAIADLAPELQAIARSFPGFQDEPKKEPESENKVEPEKEETKKEPKDDAKDVDPEPDKPKEGTPDKALQKMQQDLSAATRRMDQFQEKLDAGETLTPKEKGQLDASRERLEKIRAKLTEAEYDPFDAETSKSVAQSVIELSERLDETRAELADEREQRAMDAETRAWEKAEGKWPGLNHKEIWDKAAAEATEDIGDDDPVKHNKLASKYFRTRCDAAHARTSKKDEEKKPKSDDPKKVDRISADSNDVSKKPANHGDEQLSAYLNAVPKWIKERG